MSEIMLAHGLVSLCQHSRRAGHITLSQLQTSEKQFTDHQSIIFFYLLGQLEALLPVLRGQLPLIVVANRRSDIETALRIGREYKLKMILGGAAEGWMIPNEIVAAGNWPM